MAQPVSDARAATVAPELPAGVAIVTERRTNGGLYVHDGWAESLSWLTHGITAGDADMGLFGGSPVGDVLGRWQQLRDRLGCAAVVHARQVHEATVLVHDAVSAGTVIAPDADAHATARAGVLLAVTVADCVPIFVAAPDVGAVALLHGGWRGVAGDILEHGVSTLMRRFGAERERMHVHLGPAICGACFEVGPEVPKALGLATSPPATHVDVRAALAHRAIACGVPAGQISVSSFCTRHGDSPFFSHRGGCAERQLAVLAVRPAAG
ncbi:MAG TPA: polyphenol oxidase family protein [Longimicrobiales bacterium]|nr:polyphenol oxidase family protein [Longimicrobiales bacterium]